jgi:hypothetical protein
MLVAVAGALAHPLVIPQEHVDGAAQEGLLGLTGLAGEVVEAFDLVVVEVERDLLA